MKVKKIFSLGLAKELIQKGNKLLRIEEDCRYKDRKVFIFEWNEKLTKDFSDIKKNFDKV